MTSKSDPYERQTICLPFIYALLSDTNLSLAKSQNASEMKKIWTGALHEPSFTALRGLAARVNEALREVSSRGQDATLVYVDASDFPGAFSLAGRYRVEGSEVTTRVSVFKGEKQVGSFTLAGPTADLDKLVAAILSQAEHVTQSSQ